MHLTCWRLASMEAMPMNQQQQNLCLLHLQLPLPSHRIVPTMCGEVTQPLSQSLHLPQPPQQLSPHKQLLQRHPHNHHDGLPRSSSFLQRQTLKKCTLPHPLQPQAPPPPPPKQHRQHRHQHQHLHTTAIGILSSNPPTQWVSVKHRRPGCDALWHNGVLPQTLARQLERWPCRLFATWTCRLPCVHTSLLMLAALQEATSTA